jgi:uncharacterized membrane protein YkgB
MSAGAPGLVASQVAPDRRGSKFESVGVQTSRYGLVAVLLLIGMLKFTPAEAAGIQPLIANSPFMFWMYSVLSVQGASNVIGVIEIIVALLIALRPVSAAASFVGSLGGAVTFLFTLSFLFSAPGAATLKYGLPVLGSSGQFLIKDLVLLGVSLWTAAETYSATTNDRGAQAPACSA